MPKVFAQLTAFPMNAVISLGGCTASFVSNQGLMAVTDRHCAYGSIQHNSAAPKQPAGQRFLTKI